MYLSALFGFGLMLALASASQGQPPGGAPPAAPPAQSNPGGRPTIAVFNMVAVMKDYNKAKYQVWLLTEERKRMSGDLTAKRGEFVKLQQDVKVQANAAIAEQMQKKIVELGREIEDRTREIDKQLNEKATVIISSLYDEIKTVVDKTAEMNGYHIVFAYPDASSPEEAKSAYMKELKLKPPAAQPFYVARHVDITGVVIQTLNTWYPSQTPPSPADQNRQQAAPNQPPPNTPAPNQPPR
jgi:Skp family chaperone for outer membrane proteins